MRCHICDRDLPNPTFNRAHNEFDPCGVCLEVIANVFGDEPDPEPEEEILAEPTDEELAAADEEVSYDG